MRQTYRRTDAQTPPKIIPAVCDVNCGKWAQTEAYISMACRQILCSFIFISFNISRFICVLQKLLQNVGLCICSIKIIFVCLSTAIFVIINRPTFELSDFRTARLRSLWKYYKSSVVNLYTLTLNNSEHRYRYDE